MSKDYLIIHLPENTPRVRSTIQSFITARSSNGWSYWRCYSMSKDYATYIMQANAWEDGLYAIERVMRESGTVEDKARFVIECYTFSEMYNSFMSWELRWSDKQDELLKPNRVVDLDVETLADMWQEQSGNALDTGAYRW